MADLRVVAEGLSFPEGPVPMPDGTVLVVEIAAERLTRVHPDGRTETVAELPGGPNGAALGPDGAVYVCNNGGYYEFTEIEGMGMVPLPSGRSGGSLQRVDVATGAVETLYTHCDGLPLVAPNDLVMDGHGGCWLTDHGVAGAESAARPGLLYASLDGSGISGAVRGLEAANGVGLSPEGDRVYVAETHHGRLWAWSVTSPGVPATSESSGPSGGVLLHDAEQGVLFDSLQVDAHGWISVATIGQGRPGGVSSISPDGASVEFLDTGDFLTTNVAFGGEDARTAYITCSSSGRLMSARWPRPGRVL